LARQKDIELDAEKRNRARIGRDIAKELDVKDLIIKKKEIHVFQLTAQLSKLLKMTRYPRLVRQLWDNYHKNKDLQVEVQDKQLIELSRLHDMDVRNALADETIRTSNMSSSSAANNINQTLVLDASGHDMQPAFKVEIKSTKRQSASQEPIINNQKHKVELNDAQNFLHFDESFQTTKFKRAAQWPKKQHSGSAEDDQGMNEQKQGPLGQRAPA